MGEPSLDQEFMQYWSKLSVVQKESLLSVAKNFTDLYNDDNLKPMSLQEYNEEIDLALRQIEEGNHSTLDELKDEMKTWRQEHTA